MSSLTESDMKLLVLVMQNCKEPIQPDYKAMAEKGGYARVPTVQVAWSRLKKKIEAGASAAAATGTPSGKSASSSKATTPSSSKAVTPKKRGIAEKAPAAVDQDGEGDAVNDDSDDDDPIPAKHARSFKTPSRQVKTEEELEDESVFD